MFFLPYTMTLSSMRNWSLGMQTGPTRNEFLVSLLGGEPHTHTNTHANTEIMVAYSKGQMVGPDIKG